MGVKRILAVKSRNRKFLRAFLLVALVAAAALFVQQRKEFLIAEAHRSLEQILSHESEMEVTIGKVGGNLAGEVRFEDVRILRRGIEAPSERLVFSAKRVSVHYRFIDFLSKKFGSKILIEMDRPSLIWRPRLRMSADYEFPFLEWMRDWAASQRDNIVLHAKDLEVMAPATGIRIEGVELSYGANRLSAAVPLRHLTFGSMDVSTVIKAEGEFKLGLFGGQDSIDGEIGTEGTVINWSPLPEESKFTFQFSRSGFRLSPSRVLGGIDLEGEIDFRRDLETRWSLTAENYPLSNLAFLFKSSLEKVLPSHADVELRFEGPMLSPSVQGRARIYNGHVGKKTFKAMDLNVSGVYPTVHLENSRLLLQDDSVMRFADRTLEFRELFRDKTYSSLVNDAQQEMVAWGDWEIRRDRDIKDQSQVLVERAFGDRARVNLHEYREESTIQNPETQKLEVGLEYRLTDKNKLKLGVREDDKFVGVERKMTF